MHVSSTVAKQWLLSCLLSSTSDVFFPFSPTCITVNTNYCTQKKTQHLLKYSTYGGPISPTRRWMAQLTNLKTVTNDFHFICESFILLLQSQKGANFSYKGHVIVLSCPTELTFGQSRNQSSVLVSRHRRKKNLTHWGSWILSVQQSLAQLMYLYQVTICAVTWGSVTFLFKSQSSLRFSP